MIVNVVALSILCSIYADNGNVHVDRIGNPLLTITTSTHVLCHNECAEINTCAAWSWHRCEERCRLFDKDERIPFSNITSIKCGGVSGSMSSRMTTSRIYSSLKLNEISPNGWLLRQLQLQATGQAGHLDEFWNDIEHSIWIGGTYDHSGAGHERGPYWLNGQVPLAALLNASNPEDATTKNVVNQTEYWIHYVLSNWVNATTGWLGPDGDFGDPYWSGWNMAVSLLQYSTAHTGTEIADRCQSAVLGYLNTTYSRMLKSPLVGWSQTRYQDLAYIAILLSETSNTPNKQLLYDLALLSTEQGIDWVAYYNRDGVFKVPEMNVPTWTQQNHGVNNAMGTKAAVVGAWIGEQGRINKTDLDHQILTQDRWHGQPHGMFSADECFGGRGLSRGIELCAVVEQMYSLELAFSQFGDTTYIDKAERIALNALPGTITSDMWQHQYLQQANSISATYKQNPHIWQTDGGDATGFGVEPNFGCCTANHPQGWPKFAQNVFLTYQNDNNETGVAMVFIAPVVAQFTTGSLKGVRVELVTDYPFDDMISITASLPEGMKMLPLRVRIPEWATTATMTQSGKVLPVTPGMMNDVVITSSQSTVLINLAFQIRLETEWGAGTSNAAALLVGPLLYGLPLTEKREVVKVWQPFGNTDIDITTTDKWDFALVLNPDNLTQTLQFHKNHESNPLPFQNNNFSSTITAVVRSINGWNENQQYSISPTPPTSPHNCTTFPGSCSEEFKIQLVPYGATNIRMGALPWICTSQSSETCYGGISKITAETRSVVVTYGEVAYNGTVGWVDDAVEDVTYWTSGSFRDINKPSSLTLSEVLLESTATLKEIKLEYQYMTNKTSHNANSTVSFTVSLLDIDVDALTPVWTSPPLSNFPIQDNIWSPLQVASIPIAKHLATPHRIQINFNQVGSIMFLKAPLTIIFYWW